MLNHMRLMMEVHNSQRNITSVITLAILYEVICVANFVVVKGKKGWGENDDI